MKKLAEQIRENIVQRRKNRRLTTALTAIAGILVFITVYTLVLPAFALQDEASCGKEVHEHTDACYSSVLDCDKVEHTHDDGCYDEEGNLTCDKEEHTHDDSCYKKELTCGKEKHVHTAACYKKTVDETADTVSEDAQEIKTTESTDKKADSHSTAAEKNKEKASDGAEKADEASDDAAEEAAEEAAEDLEPVDLSQYLTEDTGLWYYRSSDKEKAAWTEVKRNTGLQEKDLVSVHLAFQFKKGTVTEDMGETIYELPDSIEFTDVIAKWLNDDNHGMNQMILGKATPDKPSKSKDSYAGKYTVSHNEETDKWELAVEWDNRMITQNAKKNVNVWADMYITGKALKPMSNGTGKVIFTEKNINNKKIAALYAGIVDEDGNLEGVETGLEHTGEISLADYMTKDTGLWYYRPSNKETASWNIVRENTTLKEKDLVCLHLAFLFKEGTINTETYETTYELPDNIEFTDVIASWLNDANHGMNQITMGKATPDNPVKDEDSLAGTYTVAKNEETGAWEMIVTWEPRMIGQCLIRDVDAWTDLYLTGKAINPLDDGSNMVIFSYRNQDGKEISTTYAGMEKEAGSEDEDVQEDIMDQGTTSSQEESSREIYTTDINNEASTEGAEADTGAAETATQAAPGAATAADGQETATQAESAPEATTEAGAADAAATDATGAPEAATQAAPADEYSEGILTYTGKDYTVTATYGADARLPEGVKLDVREIREDSSDKTEQKEFQDYLDQASEALKSENNANVTSARFFDITFTDGNKELEPAAPVNVKIEYKKAEALEENHEVAAVHLPEKADNEVLTDVEVQKTGDAVKEVEFTAENFSVYGVVAYTVDYYINGFEYHMTGGGTMKLSELFRQLEINEDVHNVVKVDFTDDSLLKITADWHLGFVGSYDWTIESLKAFTSEETLLITLKDGTQLVVKVTDAQYTNDLSSLLTDISVTVNGQKLKDNQTLNSGDKFSLHLEMTENDFLQFPDDTTEMVYQLPAGITLDSATTYITINMGIDGKVYRNKLVYDPASNTLRLTWNTKDPNFSKLISNDNTKIVLDLSGSFNENATHVVFSDDLSVDIVPEEHHDADINKSGQLYLPGANGNPYNQPAIKYTVTVTSDGTTTVNVKDVVEGSAVTLDTTNWTATSNKGTTIRPMFTNKGFTLNNQSLQDGEVVTITYWGKVDTSGIQNLTDVSYSQTGNKVTLTGDNIPTKEKTHYEHVVGQNKMSKSAEHVGDVGADGKQTIDWKIVANSNPQESIGGSTITDRIAADSRQYMSYSGTGIKVVAKRSDGTVVSTNTYNWNSLNLSLTDTDWDKHWTFTVPNTNEALTYEITYTTEVDTTKYNNGNGGLFTVVNNTEGKPGTSSGSAAAGTPATPQPQPVNYTKKAVDVTEDKIVWNISVNIDATNSGYYNPFNITEYIPNHAFGNIGYTDDLESISVEGLQGSEWYNLSYNYTKNNDDAWKRTGDSTKPTEVVLTFYRDGKQGDDVQNKNEQNSTTNPGINASTNRTLTIQVVTKNSEGWMELAARDGIAHQDYLTHTNSAKINDWSQVSATANPMAKVVYKMRDGKVEVKGPETASSYKAVETPGNSQGTITDNEQVKYPAYKFWVIVGGVTKDNLNENNQVVIEDEFDPLFRLMLDNEFGKGTRYGYGSSPTSFDAKTPDASSGESFSWTQSDGKATFVITNPKKNGDNYYPYYMVEYWLVPKSEEAYQQIKQVTLEEGGEKLFENNANSGDSKAELDFKYNYNVIDKSSVAESSDALTLLKYTININQDKLKLNNGQTMTMTDTYSQNLAVDFGSITVTAVDKNDNDRSADVTWDYRGNVGTFTIPDETYVVLQYNARVVGDPGSVQTVSNTAYMEGYFDTETKEQIVDISGGGTSERVRIRLLKFAADHMEGGLDGAVFRLLDQDMNPVIDMNGNEVTYTTGTGYLNKYGVIHAADDKLDYVDKGTGDTASYDAGVSDWDLNESGRARWQAGTIANPTSDPDKIVTYADLSPAAMTRLGITLHSGFAEIYMNQNTQGAALKKERVYYLEEIKTPVGPDGQHYEKTNVKYSFLISDQSDYSAPGGIYVYHNNDVMTVRNWPTEKATLQISKTFTGNVELTDDQKNKVTFTIKKKNSEGVFVDFPISVYNAETGKVEQKATFTYGDKKDADGTPLFVDGVLTIEDIEAGEYQVVESNAEITDTTETVKYRTEYLVDGDKQTPTDSGVTVTITDEDIQNNASHDVAVTNSYFTNKYELQKYAADTAQAISGAKFKIVKIDPDTGAETTVKENLETDSDGKLDIRFTSNTWDSTIQFDTRALYYVVETAAPTGFVLPTTPEKYYFYFSANPATEQPSDWTPGKKSTENPGGLPSGETAVDLAKSYGSAAVPNRRDTTKTYISVNKKWVNSLGRDITSTMTDAEAVSVNLYRTTQKLTEGTVITNGDTENTNEASEIKTLTVKNGDTVVNTLYFLPGDKVQITAQGAELKDASLNVNPYQVSKELVKTDTRKSWSITMPSSDTTATIGGATGATGVTAFNVTAANRVYVLSKTQAENITKDSSFSQTATLNTSGNWTHTFSDLDVTDTSTGLNYFYYVVEDDATTDTTYDVGSKSITVTNKAPDQLEVNKRWEDNDGNSVNNEKTDGSITYELYQVENPLAVGPYSGTPGGYSIISNLTASNYGNDYNITFTGNTTNVKNGSKLKIVITTTNRYNASLDGEISVSGGTASGTGKSDDPAVIENFTSESSTEWDKWAYRTRTILVDDVIGNVTLSGTVICSNDSNVSAVVTVLEEPTNSSTAWNDLVKNKMGEIEVTYNNATLTKETAFANSNFRVTPGAKAWSSLVYNLPSSGKKDGKTVNYTYYVVEKEVSGFATSYQLDGTSVEYANGEPGGTIVIVNKELEKPKGSVAVTKNFSGITENELPKNFKITASWTEGETNKTAELTTSGTQPENVSLSGSWPNYTWTINELPRDTVVTFTETGYDVAGYNVNVTGSSAAEDKTIATATAAKTPGTASFTNTYEKKVTDFEFTKEWHDVNDKPVNTWETDTTITVEVYKYLTPDTTRREKIGTYEITKEESGFNIKASNGAPTLTPKEDEGEFTFQMLKLDEFGTVGLVSGDLKYFALESVKVDGYKDPIYKNPSQENSTSYVAGNEAQNHGKIINQPEASYDLPNTGGIGTDIFRFAGIMLIALGTVLYGIRTIRRSRQA